MLPPEISSTSIHHKLLDPPTADRTGTLPVWNAGGAEEG